MKSVVLHALIIISFLTTCSPSKKEPSVNNESHAMEEDIPLPRRQEDSSEVYVVEIRQMKFEPYIVKVHKGDKVLWINKDITSHDITEQSARIWASSPLATGESWSLVVTESADYYCNLHQVMKGKIIVE